MAPWSCQAMKRYFTIIDLFCIAIAVYYAIEIIYAILPIPSDIEPSLSQKPAINAALHSNKSHPFTHYKTIMDRDLFKTKKEALEGVGRINLEDLEQTDLALKLYGTATGDDSSAYAVIEDEKNRRQDLFRVGDSIQTATLKMIMREKVVLNVDGRDEILEIEKIESRSRGGRRRSLRRGSRSTRDVVSRTPAKPRTQRLSIKRSIVENAASNITQVMRNVNIQPYYEDGKPKGMRLSRVKRDSIFRKMGLRRGDIITGVDGQKIESVDDALSLYDRLKSANNVKLEIKRRGRPRIMDYSIR